MLLDYGVRLRDNCVTYHRECYCCFVDGSSGGGVVVAAAVVGLTLVIAVGTVAIAVTVR